MFDRVPFLHITVTADALRKAMISVAQNVGEWLLHFLRDAAGSLAGVITSAIIFVYVFVALLVNREKLRTLIGQLNPLGEDVTDLYLQKMGSMVRGTVNGQFVIAACQESPAPHRSTSPDFTTASSSSPSCSPRCRSSRWAAAS